MLLSGLAHGGCPGAIKRIAGACEVSDNGLASRGSGGIYRDAHGSVNVSLFFLTGLHEVPMRSGEFQTCLR